MITRLSHATVWVEDQDAALDFYTSKLGFEVRTDISMDDFRWVTVGPPDQKDLELVLMEVGGGPFDAETGDKVRELLRTGALGTGVFHTDDCRATHEQLVAKGVEFMSAPEEQPYGVEATFRDNSGNWFSLMQRA